ncbi:TetR family transcriptional regulator [Coprobacillaceae bacterium CR2/5/TPMF4]|nr:TetR family transcriptional regulator [Coprobacillaceae bacterium CR2/5/TPMF4]
MDRHDETKYIFAQAIKDLIKVVPLDKIAVTDIVTRSGMTRQTFYRYFKDKYDLVNWYFEKLVLQSFRQMGNGCSLQEVFTIKVCFY